MVQLCKSQGAQKPNPEPEGSNHVTSLCPLVVLNFLTTQSRILIEIRKSQKKGEPIMKQGLVDLHLFTMPS